ncbi:MAG: hypothetical protein R3227_17015 [Reinekea sp.]|nr:hypothetical protein [Reinekea sp.]
MMRNRVQNLMTIGLMALLSTAAFSGGYHSTHGDMMKGYGQHSMSFDDVRTNLTLSDDQLGLLSQVEASHQMLNDMMTNIMANSLGADGKVDRSLMREQMQSNQLVIQEHEALMLAFMDSLTDEQKQQWQAVMEDKKAGCQDHRN